MYVKKGKATRAEATRAALMSAARRLFAKRGFDAVAAEEIVSRANVTRGALYHHFADGKAGLFRAIVVAEMDDLCSELAEAGKGAKSATDALGRGIRKYLDVCDDEGRRRILLVDGPAVLGWHEWRAL